MATIFHLLVLFCAQHFGVSTAAVCEYEDVRTPVALIPVEHAWVAPAHERLFETDLVAEEIEESDKDGEWKVGWYVDPEVDRPSVRGQRPPRSVRNSSRVPAVATHAPRGPPSA